ncbi:hypothetical protein HPB49_024407 [Dermacentor silvarum]|uniref:Uncharacterized protein n=1 Tax=Dermacentor silvarum TaxID=543639 RepID=A0ACB8DS14_DERSI|nr:hypothetical protein HPB49_024407 [Dermacentor silvarum]
MCQIPRSRLKALLGAGCSERNRVAFIKTHKCAGTSVQNILMRYGYSRNLTFAIGPRDVYLGHPTRFRHDMVPDLARYGRQYHILAHHNRFSTRREYARLLGNDVFIITILREPMAMFESLAATLKLRGIHIDDFEVGVKRCRILRSLRPEISCSRLCSSCRAI